MNDSQNRENDYHDPGKDAFPAGAVIPVSYQYNLLSDHQRLKATKQAIDAVVSEGDVVADLGAGSGILACLAAQKAKKVYAVEMDSAVYKQARNRLSRKNIINVEYLQGDARTIELPQRVDVVICEMLDTGLIAEHQVPVMNHAVNALLKEQGQVLPCRAITTGKLIWSDYSFCGMDFRFPHFEEWGSRDSVSYSKEKELHKALFHSTNNREVETTATFQAERAGPVNGIQLNTYVLFAEEQGWVGSSPWLNPPLNLPFHQDIWVKEGAKIRIELQYVLSGGIESIRHQVSVL